MNNAIQKAIEVADGACPCVGQKSCCGSFGGGCNPATCLWSGHAAIRKLARVCVEATLHIKTHGVAGCYCRDKTVDVRCIRALLPRGEGR